MLPPSVVKTEANPGYPIFEINNSAATAKIALQGAHIFDWTPTGQEPVLYTSPDAIFAPGKPIRGGIPICWPWFNAHPTNPEMPQHGIARTQMWELESATDTDSETECVFRLPGFELRAIIRVGADLEVELTTINQSDETFPLTEALHTYLQVGNITQAKLEGLEGGDYLDTVADANVSENELDGPVIFDTEIDRIYESAQAVTLVDESLNRQILVEKTGSISTVIWNPWIRKSKRLTDLPDDGYQHFVCIEAANAREGSCVLEPTQSHTLSTRICLI